MTHVRIKWLTWVVVITPAGDLKGGEETGALHRAIQDALAGHYQGVVLNAEEVGFATSSAVGVIVAGYSSSQRLGAKMAICCVNERNLSMQKLLDLIPLVPHFKTEEEAIRFCTSR